MKYKVTTEIMLTLLFIGMLTLAFNIQQVKASNAVSPYIAVVPPSTVDPALTPGMNYTISIYTDYNGSDVWGYEFKLTYNPLVLEGIEVVNGDLITEDVGTTMWIPGAFNNTLGELGLTGNGFFFFGSPPPVTSGPGIMANITFSVVGYGDSYISLGDETRLIGYNVTTQEVYNIIDKHYPYTGYILDGYFANQLEVIHDIAVVSVTPSKTEVKRGELLNVTVVVENQGTVDEDVTVEVYRDYEPGLTFWLIGEKSVNLEAGATKSLVFVWNTTDVPPGMHSLTAVAIELPGEDDVVDNILESDEIVGVRYALTGTIYIRADGSIEGTTDISTTDNIAYTFTDNIVNQSIVVERDNIVVDGAGYTIQGMGSGIGIDLTGRSDISLKNVEIAAFKMGIHLHQSSNISISGNNIIENDYGIDLGWSSYQAIFGNNITNNRNGIWLAYSSNNSISGNYVTGDSSGVSIQFSSDNSVSGNTASSNGGDGIYLYSSSNNNVSGNSIIARENGISLSYSSNNNVGGNNITKTTPGWFAIKLLRSSNNIIIGNILVSNNGVGLSDNSDSNIITGNTITASKNVTYPYPLISFGIILGWSSHNSITENTLTNNDYGIYLDSLFSDNKFYHNNFINNTNSAHGWTTGAVNVWDDGIEGNYWSNYTGVDLNYDGIGDSWHEINENNIDHYPLMGMFHSFNTTLGLPVNVISNSTIESFQHFESNSTIIMHVSNMTANQTHGFCRISIPYEVMSEPFNVTIDGANPTYWNYTLYDNGTHRWIYFEYEHTTREIVIVPEFPSFLILPLFMIATLLAVIVYRRKNST